MNKQFLEHLKVPGIIVLLLTIFGLFMIAPACGTIHTHAGIEHEYSYDFDDHGRPIEKKKHKKHKKPKKPSKHKHNHKHDKDKY